MTKEQIITELEIFNKWLKTTRTTPMSESHVHQVLNEAIELLKEPNL